MSNKKSFQRRKTFLGKKLEEIRPKRIGWDEYQKPKSLYTYARQSNKTKVKKPYSDFSQKKSL